MGAKSKSGKVFAVWDSSTGGTKYAMGDLSSTPFAAPGAGLLHGGGVPSR
jgi:hypothetical protein